MLGSNNNNLIANLELYIQDMFNPNIHQFHCYIKTKKNNITHVFAAELLFHENVQISNLLSRVFIRLPVHNNPIFSGTLYNFHGRLPGWVR